MTEKICTPKQNYLDAVAMAKQYPDTFQAPAANKLAMLKVGNIVKVCTGDERFWTGILEIIGDKIIARIDNDLHCTDIHGLKFGDIIKFEKRHIYQIYED